MKALRRLAHKWWDERYWHLTIIGVGAVIGYVLSEVLG